MQAEEITASFRNVFSSEEGEEVLRHLFSYCGLDKSWPVEQLPIIEGRRDVFNYIIKNLDADLFKKTREIQQKNIKENRYERS